MIAALRSRGVIVLAWEYIRPASQRKYYKYQSPRNCYALSLVRGRNYCERWALFIEKKRHGQKTKDPELKCAEMTAGGPLLTE